MYSSSQVARRLGLSTAQVQKMARQGKLSAYITPLGRLYSEEDVVALEAYRAAHPERRGRPIKASA